MLGMRSLDAVGWLYHFHCFCGFLGSGSSFPCTLQVFLCTVWCTLIFLICSGPQDRPTTCDGIMLSVTVSSLGCCGVSRSACITVGLIAADALICKCCTMHHYQHDASRWMLSVELVICTYFALRMRTRCVVACKVY